MKTWVVTFMNEDNGKILSDKFNGNSTSDAIHDFRDCYRHGYYRVIDVMEWKDDEAVRMYENKEIIVERLELLLIATRAGKGIEELILNERQDKITILFETGYTREVNIAADSGIAIIQDVVKQLL